MSTHCLHAETLSGAIALGEASDAERDVYRRHLAQCSRCLSDLGGEREIERVAATIAAARDGETWQPDLRGARAGYRRTRWQAWRVAAGAAAAAVALAFGIHAMVSTQMPSKLVVVHNVVTLDGAQVAAVTPSRRDERSIAALRTSGTMALPTVHAESLALVPAVRDAVPLGGENAIVPHPPKVAYDEGAEGTTAFEVSLDQRGTPVKCTITKSSGYAVLDDAVCAAAMKARYSPRTLDGRAVSGIYRDAFTFRSENER